MSSGCEGAIPRNGRRSPPGVRAVDPAEAVATVALAKRSVLLHLSRHRLRREDLEDCFSQAVLELIAHVRGGGGFANDRHLANALELRFNSRVRDRQRALSGRSPMQAALESALTLADGGAGVCVVDRRADVERVVIAREEVRRVRRAARELTLDQRIALAAQLSPSDESTTDFCERCGWSVEKFRKVAQRGRARLARLTDHDRDHVPLERGTSVEVPGTAYDHRKIDS